MIREYAQLNEIVDYNQAKYPAKVKKV